MFLTSHIAGTEPHSPAGEDLSPGLPQGPLPLFPPMMIPPMMFLNPYLGLPLPRLPFLPLLLYSLYTALGILYTYARLYASYLTS